MWSQGNGWQGQSQPQSGWNGQHYQQSPYHPQPQWSNIPQNDYTSHRSYNQPHLQAHTGFGSPVRSVPYYPPPPQMSTHITSPINYATHSPHPPQLPTARSLSVQPPSQLPPAPPNIAAFSANSSQMVMSDQFDGKIKQDAPIEVFEAGEWRQAFVRKKRHDAT